MLLPPAPMRTLPLALLSLLPSLALAADVVDGSCADAPGPLALFSNALTAASALPPAPFGKISFERAGWAERVDEVVFAGAITQLSIDPNRFPGCTGGQITGYVRDASGNVTVVPLDVPNDGRYTGNFVAPAGKFDVWFKTERHAVENIPGCTLWDSDLGRNYSFESRKYEPVSATFANGTWEPALDGALVPGGALVIDYDADRLTTCRTSYMGNPTWSIIAHVRFDDGRVVSKNVAGTIPTTGGPVAFAIPESATNAEVWFENVGYYPGNTNPCRAWDSRMGSNYRLAVGGN